MSLATRRQGMEPSSKSYKDPSPGCGLFGEDDKYTIVLGVIKERNLFKDNLDIDCYRNMSLGMSDARTAANGNKNTNNISIIVTESSSTAIGSKVKDKNLPPREAVS
eukprot:TRINITY_DN7287_c0_g2_i2.p4 TRINITY_DN7287_c0_g2~~TRINITY_DN7287_c0_g2_i2.p4  ORF type:complete len:107 (+),score=15.03 TRINITY_DN7287_c0_g2_i2:816-1136(+)